MSVRYSLLTLLIFITACASQQAQKAEDHRDVVPTKMSEAPATDHEKTVQEEARQKLNAKANEFRKCGYENQGKGKVVLQLVIAKTGKVSAVSIVENSTGSLDLPQCLTLRANEIRVTNKTGRDVLVRYPFNFG